MFSPRLQVGLRDGDTVYFARSPVRCLTASHDGSVGGLRCGGAALMAIQGLDGIHQYNWLVVTGT